MTSQEASWRAVARKDLWRAVWSAKVGEPIALPASAQYLTRAEVAQVKESVSTARRMALQAELRAASRRAGEYVRGVVA